MPDPEVPFFLLLTLRRLLSPFDFFISDEAKNVKLTVRFLMRAAPQLKRIIYPLTHRLTFALIMG